MPPLYEQRRILIEENTTLIKRWLSVLDERGKRNVISSMVKKYTLPELRQMRDHVRHQIAIDEHKQGGGDENAGD